MLPPDNNSKFGSAGSQEPFSDTSFSSTSAAGLLKRPEAPEIDLNTNVTTVKSNVDLSVCLTSALELATNLRTNFFNELSAKPESEIYPFMVTLKNPDLFAKKIDSAQKEVRAIEGLLLKYSSDFLRIEPEHLHTSLDKSLSDTDVLKMSFDIISLERVNKKIYGEVDIILPLDRKFTLDPRLTCKISPATAKSAEILKLEINNVAIENSLDPQKLCDLHLFLNVCFELKDIIQTSQNIIQMGSSEANQHKKLMDEQLLFRILEIEETLKNDLNAKMES